MPELPEVEVLVRHLRPLLKNKTVRAVQVRRARVLAPTPPRQFALALRGAKFISLARRGKYLVFTLKASGRMKPLVLIGHLGMTGRMYLARAGTPLPKHAAVVLNLGRENFVFEDTRYFGRLTLDTRAVQALGPEPLSAEFTAKGFAQSLKHSKQPIKVKLLDQSVIAGVGNIYASEALFCARLSPRLGARRLKTNQVERLWRSVREVLSAAIEGGSTVPLNYAGAGATDGLFYFGRAAGSSEPYEERLQVYDRAGRPCPNCAGTIRRLVQAARSTFYCPHCQRG